MPKPAMWDALTEDEQSAVERLRYECAFGPASGTYEAQDMLWVLVRAHATPGDTPLAKLRFAAERLLRLCEIAQEMEAK